MKNKVFLAFILLKYIQFSSSQLFKPLNTMDIFLNDYRPARPSNNVGVLSNQGCIHENQKPKVPTYPGYSIIPTYVPQTKISLPYPMATTTKAPLHISTPYVTSNKPNKEVFPKKYSSSSDDNEAADDDEDDDDEEDEYEDYDEEEIGNEKDRHKVNKSKFNSDFCNANQARKCELCIQNNRKLNAKTKIWKKMDTNLEDNETPVGEIRKEDESGLDLQNARQEFFNKFRKGLDTSGYSSKLHKDELFKDHIFYDA